MPSLLYSASPQHDPWSAIRWVALACAASIGLWYAAEIHSHEGILHDEAISYLAAAANQSEYESTAPVGRWVPARAWLAYWEPDGLGRWGTIRTDLARHDIHPPLYFWLLNAWLGIFPVAPWSGLLLNALLLGLAAGVVYLAARDLDVDRPAAASAGLLWAASASALASLGEARAYALVALLSVSTLWAAVRLLRAWTPGRLAVLAVLAWAGLLTNYHFALLLVATSVLLAFSLLRDRRWRALTQAASAALLAVAAFVAAHPEFHLSLAYADTLMDANPVRPDPARVAPTLLTVLLPLRSAPLVTGALGEGGELAAAALLAVLSVVALAYVMLAPRRRSSGVIPLAAAAPALLAMGTLVAVVALYAVGASPTHAMSPKYFALASPLIYVALAQAIGAASRRVGVAVSTAAVVLLLTAQAGLALTEAHRTRHASPTDYVAGGHSFPILIDTPARGYVPLFLWEAAAESPVFVAEQEEMARALPRLPARSDTIVYVSSLKYGNSVERQSRIVESLQDEGFGLHATVGHPSGIAAFVLTREGSR